MDLHRHGGPVGGDQPVIEQPVDVIPQPLAVHGVADGGEVLDELEHEVLAGRWPLRLRTTAMAAMARA